MLLPINCSQAEIGGVYSIIMFMTILYQVYKCLNPVASRINNGYFCIHECGLFLWLNCFYNQANISLLFFFHYLFKQINIYFERMKARERQAVLQCKPLC
jgi:hypothetical protein